MINQNDVVVRTLEMDMKKTPVHIRRQKVRDLVASACGEAFRLKEWIVFVTLVKSTFPRENIHRVVIQVREVPLEERKEVSELEGVS